MNNNEKLTFKDLEYLVSSNPKPQRVFEILTILKENDFEDEALQGAKLFLEDNKYDINKLREFLNFESFESEKITPLLKKKEVKIISINWYKAIAAVAASFIIGLLSYQLFFSFNPVKEYKLNDPGLPVFMSSSSAKQFDEFMNAFKLGDYKLATQLSKTLNQDNDSVRYYTALSYLELNNLEQAQLNLKSISKTSKFKPQGNYTLSLIFWKKGDIETARNLLLEIQNNPRLNHKISEVFAHKDFRK
ncbi:MAG: tetratricopeptide repeat protein [Luteibaculaceae bacterium]